MLKKMVIFTVLILNSNLSLATEISICVHFKNVSKRPWLSLSCASKKCMEKAALPPPDSFYLPKIKIKTVSCKGCYIESNYRFIYRDQTLSKNHNYRSRSRTEGVTYMYSKNIKSDITYEVINVLTVNIGVGLIHYFNWKLCTKGFCTPVPGELIIDFVKGTYKIRGDLKKGCDLLV